VKIKIEVELDTVTDADEIDALLAVISRIKAVPAPQEDKE